MKRLLFVVPLLLVLGIVLMKCGGQEPVATDTTKDIPSAPVKTGNQAKGKLGNRIEACTGSIGDFVWQDKNGNNSYEAGIDQPLAGVVITLKNSLGAVVGTFTTGADGLYSFTGLCDDTYTVSYTAPAGYCPVPCDNEADAPNNVSHCEEFPATINGGVTVTSVDFGFMLCGGGGGCPQPNSAFGLGLAGNFTVLGLNSGTVIISEAATKITGVVGVGGGTGSLLKATIQGKLWIDSHANPDLHPDLIVRGGILTQQDLSQASAAAIAASANLCGMAATQTFGTISSSVTITGNGGVNVISVAAVNDVKQTLTISGGANDLFIFNVTGGFTFSSSQMILTGGVVPTNIIWNFCGAGPDINIFKDVTVEYGTFLAAQRNIELDHSTLTGSIIAGGTIKIHSGAIVKCQ